MSLAITHFFIGIIGGLFILINFPKIIPNFVKNDVFFIILLGLWAMIPDLAWVFNTTQWIRFHDDFLSNIFWGHQIMDIVDTQNSIKVGVVTISIGLLLLYLYFKKIK